VEVSATLNYVNENSLSYDNSYFVQLRTENGLVGRVAQDTVTIPSRKRALITGSQGCVEWVSGYSQREDAVILKKPGTSEEIIRIHKTRSDDFIEELKFLEALRVGKIISQTLDLERALDTMLLLRAAHESDQNKCTMTIDYSQGYCANAIKRT